MRTQALFEFMRERHAIYQRRMQGKPKPWTKDKILQQYRFCNIYRELDTVTQWIGKNWRLPHRNDPNLWFAMCVARLVNWPDTLQALGYPVPWSLKHFLETMRERSEGGKAWGGAYIVSTNGNEMEKADYIGSRVLGPLWKDCEKISKAYEIVDWLEGFHYVLQQYVGLGSFLAAQVVADCKYVEPLRSTSDWHTWAASGPGSRRGLNRVCEFPTDDGWQEKCWLQHLQVLHKNIEPLVKKAGMPRLHAQDLQNCLCEFDKYERTRLGEGRPRSKYPGI